MREEELIIEFVPNGNFVKVTVMDPATLIEVSTVGPRNAPRNELQNAAIKKFQYVVRRDKERREENEASENASPRKGIIV